MTSLRRVLVCGCALTLGCNGSTVTDAGADDAGADAADADACGCSSGLDASSYPDLGTPAFDAWAQAQIAAGLRPPTCQQSASCPEMLMIVFGDGVDCAAEYFYDATTKKIVGLGHTCDGFALGGCTAASECIPQRCLPSMSASYGTPASCPALPDGGTPSDASAD